MIPEDWKIGHWIFIVDKQYLPVHEDKDVVGVEVVVVVGKRAQLPWKKNSWF